MQTGLPVVTLPASRLSRPVCASTRIDAIVSLSSFSAVGGDTLASGSYACRASTP